MEDYLGTDKNKADNDNDGLPDQYEYSYSPFLDPLKADSDNDTDKDGLTNKLEYKYKTDPLNKDTDQDNLSDYLEINKYGTDPLKRDTDGDKLNDGTEIRFGLDPKKTATNGTPDNQRIFSQHIPQDSSKFARYNDGSCPYKISVDMKAAGDAEGNIYVMKSGYSYSASSYVIGKMLEFSYNDDLPVKEFKLSFELDESILDNTVGTYAAVDPELKGIKRFEIFYIPKRGSSMPVSVMTKTEYDTKNNTVYITANCMGTYYLVDMEIYYKELGIEPGDIKKSQKN